MLHKILIIILTSLLTFTEIQAERKLQVEIINCGEIDAAPSTAQQDEPQTVHGHINVMDEFENPTFKPGCPTIQAKVGTRFGIHVLVKGEGNGLVLYDLVTRVTHPPLTNPTTQKTSTVDEWQSPMNFGIPRFAGWQFEEEWELIPGKWTIEILHKNTSVASKEFNVVVEQPSR